MVEGEGTGGQEHGRRAMGRDHKAQSVRSSSTKAEVSTATLGRPQRHELLTGQGEALGMTAVVRTTPLRSCSYKG
jgi:hypothetical protein